MSSTALRALRLVVLHENASGEHLWPGDKPPNSILGEFYEGLTTLCDKLLKDHGELEAQYAETQAKIAIVEEQIQINYDVFHQVKVDRAKLAGLPAWSEKVLAKVIQAQELSSELVLLYNERRSLSQSSTYLKNKIEDSLGWKEQYAAAARKKDLYALALVCFDD